MPKLVALILVLLGAAGGGAGGYFAKQMLAGDDSSSEGGHDTSAEEVDDGHGAKKDSGDHKPAKKETASKGHGEKKSHGEAKSDHGKSKSGHGENDTASGSFDPSINYFKFSRQFVVPVIADGGVTSLVLLDLNLEMDASAAESFYVREPKLRDALMEELLDIANDGRFGGMLTDRRNLDQIRLDLLHAAQDVEGDSVHDVLILDIMRQDM